MKKLIWASALLSLTSFLAACNGGDTTDPNQLSGAQLKGSLTPWPYGPITPQLFTYGDEQLTPLNGSSVSNTGDVNIRLPGVPAQPFDLLSGCGFSGTRSTDSISTELADVLLFTGPDELLGQVTYVRNSDGYPLTHMYSGQSAAFNGTATCGSTTLNLNLKLQAGWNMVAVSGGSGVLALTSVNDPASVSLKLVKAKEAVTMTPTDISSYFSLAPGQTVKKEMTFKQTGGILGPIDLTTSVQGVEVTPSTITFTAVKSQALQDHGAKTPLLQAVDRLTGQGTLTSQSLKTNITFSLNENAVSSSGPLELIASQNGVVLGKMTFTATITAPYVQATLPNGLLFSSYQGSTVNLPVTLEPANGFSGNTTISLTNLPAGVSAAPVTVNILPNASTSLNIPVTVSSSAALGTYTVKFQGTKVTPYDLTLTVKPARVQVSENMVYQDALRPAASGVWVAQSVSDAGQQKLAVQRWTTEGKQVEVKFPNAAAWTIPVPDGSLYVVDNTINANTKTMFLHHVKDDGTYTDITANTMSLTTNGVADASGRIWHFVTDTSQIGVIPYVLAYWDPVTNKTTQMNDVRSNNYSSSSALVISNNGQYLLFPGSYDSSPTLIDTQTLTTKTVGTVGSMSSAAISDSGDLWYRSGGSGLTHLNPDGTSNTFKVLDNDPFMQIIGFDRLDPKKLWLRGYSGAYSFDTVALTSTSFPTDSLRGGITVKSGGIALLMGDNGSSFSTKTWLSVLP